jgi:hypothetical protein
MKWPMRLLPREALVLAVLLPLLAGACSRDTPLQGADQAAVLAYSEPIADNLLQGLNQDDYAVFSKDFDSQMKTAIPAAAFQGQVVSVVTGRVGNYVSRTVRQVVQNGNQVTLVYNAKFDKEAGVLITLSLTTVAPHQVSGLFFDSTSLE